MRIVNLCQGKGNGVDKACLMTAASMLIGKPEEGDTTSCVCPVLREFIVPTNDWMPNDLRAELYGPLVWEILGTRSTPEVERQRAFYFADQAVRVLAPIDLRAVGLPAEAERLEQLPPIVGHETAATAAYHAAYAAAATAAAATAAYHAAYAAAATAAYHAAYHAAYAAYHAAYAAAATAEWHHCPRMIREAVAIGDTRPIETVMTHDQLCDALA